MFLPVLLIPVVLPRWAGPAGLRSRRKVSGQQVEEDTRRRHDGSQSRQGAHVAPPALRSELPPFTGKLRRKVPIVGGPEAGSRRSSRERELTCCYLAGGHRGRGVTLTGDQPTDDC